MMYEIEGRFMNKRQRGIVARLARLLEASPRVEQISLYSGDHAELLKLKDKDSIANHICFQGKKLISIRIDN